MQYELRQQVIEPQRATFDSLVARYRFYGRGRYAFQVIAVNALGSSPASAFSRTVKPR